MSEALHLTEHDGIAVLTLDNPPVNGLSIDVRKGLLHHLSVGLVDDDIIGLVITGSGRMFSAGADIREFDQTSLEPHLSNVVTAIEDSPKPIVAAIHGIAAGGGLEVALGCHYRLASPNTRVGLPEVTLGIVPGAGGTQRLPRLVGARRALELITGGRLISVDKAHAIGLVDEIIPEDLVDASICFVRRLVEQDTVVRRTRDLDIALKEAAQNPNIFDNFRAEIDKRARGFDAPQQCIACVETAVSVPFTEGLAKERKTFQQLLVSDQSKAQRHVFFAEREITKIPDVARDTPTTQIDKAAVIGCGTMGGGIAMNFANAGIPVTIVDMSREAVEQGLAVITKNYKATVAKGRMSQAAMDERLGLISSTLEYRDIADVDIVVEAVFEKMDVKKAVFHQIDAVCKPGTILATNTSTLDINTIASATKRPGSVIGTHFFSPANVMRLMENVRGKQTSKQTIATVMQLSKRLGKFGVMVGVCDGFVGNRMLAAYQRQAEFLLEEGALPQQVDKALYDFGFPMGPFQMLDMAGLDVGWFIRQRQAATRPQHLRYSFLADRICERGRFGQKTGSGWYQYEQGSRLPKPDPSITEMIKNISAELAITRRAVETEEIITRCLYPLVNEGAKILEEGLALRASDIDIVWIYGYGFPRYKGGPMFWADLVGVKNIYESMVQLHDDHGEWLRPAPLLKQLAHEGKKFGDL